MRRHNCGQIIVVTVVLTLPGLAGCHQAPAAEPAVPPPTVTVSYPIERDVTDYEEFTGRTAAIESVQIRARVTGYLQKINFREGMDVHRDDVLFEIDPRPYEAALNQAKAQVTLQEAQLAYQEAVLQRNQKLAAQGQAVSVEELQQSQAQVNATRASSTAAKAALAQAELNLNWTKVTAPISGRIGRTLITEGNLVVADQTVLTSIVSLDPIYAYFDVDEATVLHVQELIRQGKFTSAREGGHVPVLLRTAAESGWPHEGRIEFINNQVDPLTGTLQIRGIFSNPKPPTGDRVLSSGLFVRVRVAVGAPYRALLVNQRALGTDQNIRYLYVVDDRHQVLRRDVKLGTQQGDLQVVTNGLQPQERVIVSGIQHVRPAMVVVPRLIPMPEAKPETQDSHAAPDPQYEIHNRQSH